MANVLFVKVKGQVGSEQTSQWPGCVKLIQFKPESVFVTREFGVVIVEYEIHYCRYMLKLCDTVYAVQL